MAGTAEVLEQLERCERIPFWSYEWEKRKWSPNQFLGAGLKVGLTEEDVRDHGLSAGESLYSLAVNHELDTRQMDVHSEIVHLSALSDVITYVIRKSSDPAWVYPRDVEGWAANCYLSPDGSYLRKILFVSNWNDDRHYDLCRSWSVLGEVCFHNLPMQLIVVVLGSHKDGRYHGYWSKAKQHPINRSLKFRKKNDAETGFKSSWNSIFREDFDQYSTQDWLNAMLQDDVLRDVLIKVDIEVPTDIQRQKIIDLATKRLEALNEISELPLPKMSVCHWPVPCVFEKPCHANSQPSPKWGFVRIEEIQ